MTDTFSSNRSNSPHVQPLHLLLHLFALCGIVIAQPVYSWVSRQPEFLVAHGFDAGSAGFLIATLSLALPLALWLIALAAFPLGRRVFLLIASALTGTLVGLMVLQWFTGAPAWIAFTLAAVTIVAFAIAYARLSALRTVLAYLAIAGIALPVLFVLTEPVRGMVWSRGFDATTVTDGNTDAAPIVFIVLDELPLTALLDADGEINRERFPGFGKLADSSTWFPNATTVSVSTTRALPAFLTGRMPDANEQGLAQWQRHPDNLFTWSAMQLGAPVVGVESITQLCPQSICARNEASSVSSLVILGQDISVLLGYVLLPHDVAQDWLPEIDNRWNDFLGGAALGFADTGIADADDSDTLAQFNETVSRDRGAMWRSFTPRVAPGFNFLHLLLPHDPYTYLTHGQQYEAGAQGLDDKRWRTEGLNVLEYQRMLTQLQYTDSLLMDMIDELRASDLWTDALVVVASDHGKSFRLQSHKRKVQADALEDLLRIPLFVKRPGQTDGEVDEYPARITDVAPTIADLSATPLSWEAEGASLFAADRPPRPHLVVSCVDATCDESMDASGNASEIRVTLKQIQATGGLDWKQRHIIYLERLGLFSPRSEFETLVSKNPATLSVTNQEVPGVDVELLDHSAMLDVDPTETQLPALIRGRVTGPESGTIDRLGISLNGTLIAVTQPASWRGKDSYFAALAPASLFIEGRNRVSFFEITRDATGQAALAPLQKRRLVLVPGDTLIIGGPEGEQANPHLGTGWSGAGRHMRWTDGPSAEMYLEPEPAPQDSVVLRLKAHGFLARGEIEHQNVTLTVNNRKIEQWKMTGTRWYEATIPADIVSEGLLHLVFTIDNPAAPCDFGFSEDCRQLGMAVKELQLIPTQQ